MKKEIENYINSFNSNKPFDLKNLVDLLSILSKVEMESFDFTIYANKAAQTIHKSIEPLLEEYLQEFKSKYNPSDDIDQDELNRAFTVYYLLIYYEREYEKMDKIENALAMYEPYFIKEYALASQIRGRFYRRNGNEKKALECDKRAKNLLQEKGIENIGVDITYASTISILSEKRSSDITFEDIHNSIQLVKKAILLRPDYPKYLYLLAKLQMFQLLYEKSYERMQQYEEIIDEAKSNLRQAIQLENENADYYAISVAEYKSYMRQANFILAEMRLTILITNKSNQLTEKVDNSIHDINKKFASNLQKQKNNIEKRFVEQENDVEKRFVEQQSKNFELLALFSSIVAIIVVVIGLFSKEYSLENILIAIIVMNACVVTVYATILVLLSNKSDKKGKYYLTLLISFIIVIAILILIKCNIIL